MSSCTDPTYKEWKPVWIWRTEQILAQHGSYLQGMETYQLAVEERKLETGTDPTYKEWKLLLSQSHLAL